jgi:hypothetical protein
VKDSHVLTIDRYIQTVQPRFPVLSMDVLKQDSDGTVCPHLPVGISAAVFALAIPFSFLDDELSVCKGYAQLPTDDLWAIVHRSFQRCMRTPHLSSLQLCLLLLQEPPHNYAVAQPPSTWALSCSALAISESLGLHLDSSHWRIPQREHKLRKKL